MKTQTITMTYGEATDLYNKAASDTDKNVGKNFGYMVINAGNIKYRFESGAEYGVFGAFLMLRKTLRANHITMKRAASIVFIIDSDGYVKIASAKSGFEWVS